MAENLRILSLNPIVKTTESNMNSPSHKIHLKMEWLKERIALFKRWVEACFMNIIHHNIFWVEVINTSCYIFNKVLIRKTLNKTPYELWKGKNLRYHSLGYLDVSVLFSKLEEIKINLYKNLTKEFL